MSDRPTQVPGMEEPIDVVGYGEGRWPWAIAAEWQATRNERDRIITTLREQLATETTRANGARNVTKAQSDRIIALEKERAAMREQLATARADARELAWAIVDGPSGDDWEVLQMTVDETTRYEACLRLAIALRGEDKDE